MEPSDPSGVLDELLVLRARAGGRGAFEALARRWQERLWRHAFRLTGRNDAAWDVLQESWMAALGGSPPPLRLRPWLASVIQRRAHSWRRAESRRARRERVAARGEAVTDAEALERGELRQALMGHVLALDEPYRSTILLHYFEELPLAEIARRQDRPAATLRSQLFRALGLLRERIQASSEPGPRSWRNALVPLAAPASSVSSGEGVLLAASAGGLVKAAALAAAGVLAVVFIWRTVVPSPRAPGSGAGSSPTAQVGPVEPSRDSIGVLAEERAARA
jgi:RNA polymerase sigma-70 factor (ECF subfamily)